MSIRLVDGRLVDSDGEEVTSPVMEETQPSTDEPEYPICESCNQANYEWQPGNRGRKPKYHRDCRPINPNRGNGRRGNSSDAALRHSLEMRYATLARTVAIIRPHYAALIASKIEDAVNAHLEYANNNPKYRKILEKSLEKTALAELVSVHAQMLGPLFVGESVRRATQKATAGATRRGSAKPNRGSEAPNREQPQRPTQTPPQPQQPLRPENVHPIRPEPQSADEDIIDAEWDEVHEEYYGDDYPAEETVEDAGRTPETVNAAAMPGMPGG